MRPYSQTGSRSPAAAPSPAVPAVSAVGLGYTTCIVQRRFTRSTCQRGSFHGVTSIPEPMCFGKKPGQHCDRHTVGPGPTRAGALPTQHHANLDVLGRPSQRPTASLGRRHHGTSNPVLPPRVSGTVAVTVDLIARYAESCASHRIPCRSKTGFGLLTRLVQATQIVT